MIAEEVLSPMTVQGRVLPGTPLARLVDAMRSPTYPGRATVYAGDLSDTLRLCDPVVPIVKQAIRMVLLGVPIPEDRSALSLALTLAVRGDRAGVEIVVPLDVLSAVVEHVKGVS